MPKPQIDLSALNTPAKSAEVNSGKPLELLISEIQEDPSQPRKEFEEGSLQELADSISVTGVRSPISVKPHPDSNSGFKWILNFGARRFRASKLAGRDRIPAFVDEKHGDYDQVVENLQRDNLTPLEIAEFVSKQISEAGESKSEVARKLGKTADFVTVHLALIEMPDCIQAIYDSKVCRSPRTLMSLRQLHEKFSAEVESWCGSGQPVTRSTVRSLELSLKDQEPIEEEGRASNATQTTEPSASTISTEGRSDDEKGESRNGTTKTNSKNEEPASRLYEVIYKPFEGGKNLTHPVKEPDIEKALQAALSSMPREDLEIISITLAG